MQKDEPDQLSQTTNRRARDFFYHLAVYVFVLLIIAATGGLNGALLWLSLFWGFAVVLHAIYAYFG